MLQAGGLYLILLHSYTFNKGALGMAAVHTEDSCVPRHICSCTVHTTQYCTLHSILYLLCAAQCTVHVCSSRADAPSQGRAQQDM